MNAIKNIGLGNNKQESPTRRGSGKLDLTGGIMITAFAAATMIGFIRGGPIGLDEPLVESRRNEVTVVEAGRDRGRQSKVRPARDSNLIEAAPRATDVKTPRDSSVDADTAEAASSQRVPKTNAE